MVAQLFIVTSVILGRKGDTERSELARREERRGGARGVEGGPGALPGAKEEGGANTKSATKNNIK
jgi:hypothetical protein